MKARHSHTRQVDFLLRHSHLVSGRATMLEIGAGWGGVAAIVKKKFPGTRYVIVDLSTSIPIQMSYLYSLGHTNIYALQDTATSLDVHALLCCTPFDALFLLPHQLALVSNRTIDITVNFDSFIEMPEATVRLTTNAHILT